MQNAAVPRRLLSALLTVAMLAALLVPGVKAVDGNRYELPTVEPGADARSTGESRIDAPAAANGHDVDMDGDTDNDDVQAILDYLTEKLTAEDVDLSVADLDKDGQITSRDALLLIGWEPEEGPGIPAAANGARTAAGLGGCPATDGTIALRHRPQRSISGSTGEAADGQAAVKLIESEEIRNGVLVLVFDKDALCLTGCTSDFAFMSYKETVNGEGKGVVKIAFADKAARKDLAVLKFSYAGETLDTIVKISYLERNEDFAGDGYMEIRLNVTKPLVVPICIVDETDSPALYAWAWGPAGSQDASWPGRALTAAGSDKGGHPWYLIDDLNLSDYNMLILNRGEGQPQSGTLNLLSDLDDGERIIYYIYGLEGDLQVSVGTDLWPAPGVVTEPGCTEGGYTTYTGMFTGEILIENKTGPLGHDWGEWAMTTAPGCTETGVETRICARCGETGTRSVEALGHLPGEAVEENRVEPTATEEGGYDTVVYCQRCGIELSREHTVLPATGGTEPIEIDTIRIYASLSIGIELDASFSVRSTDLSNYNSWYIEVSKLDADGNVTVSKRFGEGQEGAVTGDDVYQARYTDITAKELGVAFTASVHAFDADGREYVSKNIVNSEPIFTFRDYILGELTKEGNSDSIRTLAADLLNYGAAAQVYFEYDVEHLVNENLSIEAQAAMEQFASTGEAPANLVNGTNGPNVYGSLSVKNRIVLTLTIRGIGSPETVQIKIKEHDGEKVKEIIDTEKKDSVWQVQYSGLDAEDMRTLYDYVPVADGEETGTPLSWSVEGYAREARLNPDASLAELNLFNALLHYVDAVDAVDFGS